MQESSAKVLLDNFAFGACPFQQLNKNETGENIGFSGISGIFEGALADSRDKLSQPSVDPVIITVWFLVDHPFTQKTLLIVSFCDPANL